MNKDVLNIKNKEAGTPESWAHEAGHKVREFADTAIHEARDVTVATEKKIREHPFAASAIAAGIGFLLGSLFRRR